MDLYYPDNTGKFTFLKVVNDSVSFFIFFLLFFFYTSFSVVLCQNKEQFAV